MQKPYKVLTIAALTSLLGASVVQAGDNANPNWNTADVRAMSQHGNQFQQNLHNEYVALAELEKAESDTYAMAYFNLKARQSSIGNMTAPTVISSRNMLPAENVKELTDARADLVRMLDAGGPTKSPVHAARAQAQFDCWLAEQVENDKPKDTASCKDGFNLAMGQASSDVYAKAPTPAPKPVAATSSQSAPAIYTYTVYFEHDSQELSSASKATNDEAGNMIRATGAKTVRVSGYTDTSGSHEYNRALANRRAKVVADAIAFSGINPIIDTVSHGENDLAVDTKNGVENWHNRRVVIRVQ